MTASEFQCAHCKQVYDKGRPDDVAMAEAQAVFGASLTQEDCATVCDDCWEAMKPKKQHVCPLRVSALPPDNLRHGNYGT